MRAAVMKELISTSEMCESFDTLELIKIENSGWQWKLVVFVKLFSDIQSLLKNKLSMALDQLFSISTLS